MYYIPRGQGVESLVTTPEYFAAGVAGRKAPLSELTAKLELFRKVLPEGDNHPQCHYPYQYKLLSQSFQLAPKVNCPALDTWLKNYEPKGLSVVYASQYISNPSSAFGHSFLMATSGTRPKGLNLTYNFSASMPADISTLSYVWGGLAGWYPGAFSTMPFYQRIFYYGNVENRDLWIYPIRLNSNELDLVFRRLWEAVHSAQFTYYFLDENCAGLLLRVFSGVIPELKNYHENAIYTHPVDVIRVLSKVGRLDAPELVPSQLGQLHRSVKALKPELHDRFSKIISNPDQDPMIDDRSLGNALMEFTAYQETQNQGKVLDTFKKLQRAVFIGRAKLGIDDGKAEKSPQELQNEHESQVHAPHLAHDSFAATVGGSIVNDTAAVDLSYRVALHSQLDPPAGFLDFSSFEALSLTASFSHKAIWLKDFTLVNVENYQPYWSEAPSGSWRIKLHLKENLLKSEPKALYSEAQFSYGAGLQLGKHLVYAVLVDSNNFGNDLPQGHIEIGPEVGVLARWTKVHAYANASYGTSLFFGHEIPFFKATVGASLFLNERLTLIQDNEFSRLPLKQIQGYRSSLSARFYF